MIGFRLEKKHWLALVSPAAVHQAGRGAVMAAAAKGPSNTSLAWTPSRWRRRPTGSRGALASGAHHSATGIRVVRDMGNAARF
jgi:hypothetical protein